MKASTDFSDDFEQEDLNHAFDDMPPDEESLDDDDSTSSIVAAETLYGDLVRIVLDEIKHAPRVWQKMTEDQQSHVIDRVHQRCNDAASKAILAAFSGSYQSVGALVEQVVFKDGIKCVLKIAPHAQGRHELADREGFNVVLLLMDPSEFGADEPPPEPEPDQRGLALVEQQSLQASDPDAVQGY
ncbi:hypothetical protein NFC81_09200 [Salinispirillum sp. LH 10-3-1]|uniref:Uncharacterized protein n=1 Tax=Salinispirillum sp. LH 10-3-1 TaxID=2952525 RepID=A0AB38YCL1_9GAMM